MKYSHRLLLVLGIVLSFSTFANSQNVEQSKEKTTFDKTNSQTFGLSKEKMPKEKTPSSFDRITMISTAAAIGLTIANVEGSHRAIRSGKACERSFAVQAADGCGISRAKAYTLGFTSVASTLLIQRFKPEWKKPLEGVRFSLAAGNGIGWGMSM